MNRLKEFQKGQKIRTASGGELEVLQKLGEGGQGVVYKVNYNGKQLALKWYFGNKLSNADKFYRNIQNNIKQGAPTDAFLWPLEITELGLQNTRISLSFCWQKLSLLVLMLL